MTLTNTEFETILNDTSKRLDGDIIWQEDEDHSPCVEFRAEVQSEAGWPLFVRGSYNPLIPALSYSGRGEVCPLRRSNEVVLKAAGRVE